MNVKLEPCTILIAEDDPNDVILIRRAFRKANLANPLQIVKDGADAIAYLAGEGRYADRARHPFPGLVLLDLKMPVKSGLEVLEWLREQPRINRVRIVVLTSSRESPDVNRAYDLGASSYLVKPVSLDHLVALVRTLDMYWLILNEPPRIDES